MPLFSKLNTSKTFEKKAKAVVLKIRQQRVAKGFTQDFLAFKLGISQNAYSKIELGLTKITIDRLFIIALILEVDINVLLGK